MSCTITSSDFCLFLPSSASLQTHQCQLLIPPHWSICTSFSSHAWTISTSLLHLIYHRGYSHLVIESSSLIFYLLECPHIRLIVLFWHSHFLNKFLTSQHSAMYNIVGLTTTLLNLHLIFSGTFLSHRTLETSLRFVHPVPIRCETSSVYLPFALIKDPRETLSFATVGLF